jgi:hypothetical protein
MAAPAPRDRTGSRNLRGAATGYPACSTAASRAAGPPATTAGPQTDARHPDGTGADPHLATEEPPFAYDEEKAPAAQTSQDILTGIMRDAAEAALARPTLTNDRDTTSATSIPPTGTEITAKSWLTEAPMRMLMNNLHPDVAENPHELVVYGGIGRAARTWEDFDRHRRSAEGSRRRRDAAGAVGQAGGHRPHPRDAPRVLIANSNLVPQLGQLGPFQRAR